MRAAYQPQHREGEQRTPDQGSTPERRGQQAARCAHACFGGFAQPLIKGHSRAREARLALVDAVLCAAFGISLSHCRTLSSFSETNRGPLELSGWVASERGMAV